MPYTTSSDGARLHYEVHGAGDPVLLIMGLGSNAYGWHRSIPWLAERYEVIAFDNRGTGRSDVPAGAYTIGQMATDAAAVLDAAGRRQPPSRRPSSGRRWAECPRSGPPPPTRTESGGWCWSARRLAAGMRPGRRRTCWRRWPRAGRIRRRSTAATRGSSTERTRGRTIP